MMAVADVVCVFACIFGMTAPAAEFNKVVYSDSGDIVPGEMTSQFKKAKSYADDKNIPLVVMWVNPGCGFCENFERSCLRNQAVLAWMKEKKYVFVFCFGQDDSDGRSAWTYTRQADLYPMCRVHWKRNSAGEKVDYSFTGRNKKMHESQAKTKLNLAEQFMEVVEMYAGDYEAGTLPAEEGIPEHWHGETQREMDPIGVCSWSWHEPMTNIIRRMEANGFKGIQLALSPWVWEGEGSAAQKETFGDQEGEEVFNLISNKFAKGELDIHATMICFSNEDYTTEHTISNTCGFYYGLAPSATEEQKALADLTWEIRSNQFAKAVERTRMLGVRNITAHIGLVHLDVDNMSRLYWACKTCQENGCRLLVETGMYSAKDEVAALVCFTNMHPDVEIGLNFDTANQILYGADNPTNAYAVMKDWIEQVHVKDCVEAYSERGAWATDVEWGRGDVSQVYDMINVLKTDGFVGPMLVEHESGSPDPDVREREILTAVTAIRGDPAPVVAGLGDVLGPYPTAEAATNAAQGAVFTPSVEVVEALDSCVDTMDGYCAKFGFAVVPTSGGQWAVVAALKPEARTEVLESAQEATRQIPLADIAALPLYTPTNVTAKGCGVPGFYYSFYSGSTVTNLGALADEKGRNVLCGTDGDVEFSGVVKPSDTAGFFSIGVKETPGVMPSDADSPKLVPPAIMDVQTD